MLLYVGLVKINNKAIYKTEKLFRRKDTTFRPRIAPSSGLKGDMKFMFTLGSRYGRSFNRDFSIKGLYTIAYILI